MIRWLRMENFKCFEKQEIELGALTLLSGLNGMGKSTVLQALLLLRQSYQQELLQKTGLALNGDLVKIGTAQDALFEDAKEEKIGLELELAGGNRGKWRFNYNKEADVLDLDQADISKGFYRSNLFKDNFHYLQAERLGPRRFFEMSVYQVQQHKQIGTKGEFAAHLLDTYGSEKIIDADLAYPNSTSLKLRDQVEAWLEEISPGKPLKHPHSVNRISRFSHPDNIRNPKKRLNRIFTQELGPRRCYVDYRHALLIAREIADFSRIRRSESFQRFALKIAPCSQI